MDMPRLTSSESSNPLAQSSRRLVKHLQMASKLAIQEVTSATQPQASSSEPGSSTNASPFPRKITTPPSFLN